MPNQFYTTQRIRLDLSQPEQTEAGRLLYKLYYGYPSLLDALPVSEASGFPHNGGMHTLRVSMTLPDLRAFWQLLAEEYVGARGLAEFLTEFDAKYLAQTGHHLVH